MSKSKTLLQFAEVEKSFFNIPVLKKVSFDVSQGKTLGLLGENGAGKSTLMNILGGNLPLDAGKMVFAGEPYSPHSPRDAEAAGIAFIHQELNLFPNLSIAENLFLTCFQRRLFWIDRRSLHRRAKELLEQVGLDLSPRLLVENLSSGERQLVEIAKALNLDAKLIILDEPTTSLTERETVTLFELLRSLQERGISMIYISHALGEIEQLCDEVVILRDGAVVDKGATGDFPTSRIVSLMVGREMDQLFPARKEGRTNETTLLQARSVSQPGVAHNISFSLHKGEVLGLAGLMGSGRTEIARILFGLDPMESGSVELCQQDITSLSTRQRIQEGMAMLTESRREDGLCMSASIRDNIGLVAAPKYTKPFPPVMDHKALWPATETMRESVKLTPTASHHQAVRTLSGGNQQKVVLAKWLLNLPQVLILDEPTRGIDIGAKQEIYRLIAELADSGTALLVISSEIEELIGVCDRILVMSEGEIKDELNRNEFDCERIMHAALQAHLPTGGTV